MTANITRQLSGTIRMVDVDIDFVETINYSACIFEKKCRIFAKENIGILESGLVSNNSTLKIQTDISLTFLPPDDRDKLRSCYSIFRHFLRNE